MSDYDEDVELVGPVVPAGHGLTLTEAYARIGQLIAEGEGDRTLMVLPDADEGPELWAVLGLVEGEPMPSDPALLFVAEVDIEGENATV